MLAFVKKILFALFVLVLLVFLYQNLEALGTTVPFVFDLFVSGVRYETPEFPVWLLFAVFFLFGMIAAGFHGIYERMARRVEIRRRDKRIRELEKEVGELRGRAAELKPPPEAEERLPPDAASAAGSTRTAAPTHPKLQGPPAPRSAEEEPTL
jgi:hypothetical protein